MLLKNYADLLLDSMAGHDPALLPLASRYAATEDAVPGAIGMMTGWRTVTGVNRVGQYVVDVPAGQVFVTASLDEGGTPTLFWARLKVVADQITELEMYRAASRKDGGFVMLVDDLGTFPAGWTSPVPDGQRATRQELVDLGRAIFDNTLPAPEPSPDSILMEVGGVVFEDREYHDLLMTGQAEPVEAAEKLTMQMGLPPFRPSDPHARVAVVDEEQGIVVSIATITGFVSPYVIRTATESCFVPGEMIDMHRRTIRAELLPGRQVIEEMPATCINCQVMRLHSGQIQGGQMFNRLVAPGGRSPWVTD